MLLQLVKWCVPLIMTPPLVDLAVRLQPANTSISLTSPWNLYFVTTSTRYQINLLNFFTCLLVGAAMPLHTSFVAYCRSMWSNAN